MINKTLHIDITPNNEDEFQGLAGVMWEHNATQLEFSVHSLFVGENYRYYIEYRSCFGSKVRTEYLDIDVDNIVLYPIPVEMSSLKAVEGYFCIVEVDGDGNTTQVIKPQKFNLTFDYSADIDNQLCKVNDFSINYLLEAIRQGTFKGETGEKGDRGEKGEKGETGGISEVTVYNNFANAIVHSVEGKAVAGTYISDFGIEARINMNCKNLLDVSQFTTIEGSLINNGDGTITLPATVTGASTGIKLKELCPNLKAGQVAVLNYNVNSNVKKIQLSMNGAYPEIKCGTPFEVTDTMLNSIVNLCGIWTSETNFGEPTVISELQIELGEIVTEYTPYVAPQKLKVKKYSKNLLSYPYSDTTKEENGITFTDNGDGTITVNGTATAHATFKLTSEFVLPPAKYALSGCPKNSSSNNIGIKLDYNSNESISDIGSGTTINCTTTGENFAISEANIIIVSGTTVNNLTFKPQLELDKVTEYEMYSAPEEYSANYFGKVLGVVFDHDKTTLIPTTPAQIKCQYNRDTTKIIDKLIALANSLGADI